MIATRLNRLTIRPAPVDDTLTRAELVAGLRRAFQQVQIDLALQPEGRDECSRTVATTLYDVAAQFGLSPGEVEEILGKRLSDIVGVRLP